MEPLDRYLAAIAERLPADKADDIVAELRDVLTSRFEEEAEARGRSLDRREQEQILTAFGPPIEAAARYGPPRYLIGPEVFPYWWACLKALLFILSAIFVSLCFADLLFASGPSGPIIAHAIGAVWTGGWAATGAVTVFFALLERFGARTKLWRGWAPPPLSLGESRTSRWNRISSITGAVVVLLWWVGVLKVGWPAGWTLVLHPSGLADAVFWPVIVLLCGGMAANFLALVRPDLRAQWALAIIAVRLGSLALAAFVWSRQPHVTLAVPFVPPGKLAGVEVDLDWTIRIGLLAAALTALFDAARETWRLTRRAAPQR